MGEIWVSQLLFKIDDWIFVCNGSLCQLASNEYVGLSVILQNINICRRNTHERFRKGGMVPLKFKRGLEEGLHLHETTPESFIIVNTYAHFFSKKFQPCLGRNLPQFWMNSTGGNYGWLLLRLVFCQGF